MMASNFRGVYPINSYNDKFTLNISISEDFYSKQGGHPIFSYFSYHIDWYVAWYGSKNGYKKDVCVSRKKIGFACSTHNSQC